jgi:rRNA maturation RNase YbeY
LRDIGLPDAELSVLFVGDHAMLKLNHAWRGKKETTDVLSFSLREGRFKHIRTALLGDIVISVPTAERQARAEGHALSRELDRLLVHGLVHLLGYDHARGAEEARRMASKERQLLRKLT